MPLVDGMNHGGAAGKPIDRGEEPELGIYILDTPDGKTGSLLTELCGGRWSVGATDGTPLTGLKAYAAERCYTVEPRRWFRLSPT